ncbi:phosphate regulon sensor histidine kinase PhoR [Ferrimonas balearica]|uniref:phosphate regulon sensor histidine kinase PhoR n=1 Tax=Ferrimonas balearica TaxID=44012 RepID=UPI001C5788F8|nr:phosphate regulon sensor histidine kinase PhoR [Ferrimonas balearica]MBW3140006.1 phosphate regulon sensor histidine kinase PhoR [Ferrimonas balearica]MBW3165030.1 phosphate regulon sensor histidine kinase PhoR [Ferrimonas balearica]MBY6106886.1 phosphate regulon sensor histidine kinase PhoR [Ferrimonas balearica]
MFESYSGYRLLLKLVMWMAPWALLGLLVDQLALCLLIGSWLLLFWHYRHLNKLAHWLWHDRRLTPPHGSGSWEPIFNGIYRLQGKNRRRRAQLARLLSRFREGAEALPDAAMVLGPEGQILWSNQLAEHILGIRWPQDAGNRIHNLLRHPRFVKYWNKRRFSEPLELVSPVNDSWLLEVRIMAYGDSQRLLVARDVTRLRQLEQMRRDFVANVSHELKTPLTVLQGYVEMMQMTCDPESMQGRQFKAMEEQSVRMKTLIDRLLTLSRIESSTDLDLERPVDIPALMSTIQQEGETLAAGSHQLVFEVDPELKVYGDEMQLHSACANLVQNAIRYTPPGGEIRVSWRRNGERARFEVQDQGEGIAPEHLPRLTERFYRVDKARSRDTGGSGLGLAIVKHALNHHNSQLEISSAVGQGSRFAFELPATLVVQKAS